VTPITHHPSAALLIGYAAGALEEGRSLLVASHLELCASCREAVLEAETVGGGLVSTLEPDAMAEDSLERTLARLDEGGNESAAHVPAGGNGDPRLPRVLQAYLDDSMSGLAWRKAGERIAHAVVTGRKKGPTARLVHLAPGAVIPQHTHGGEELTLVLSGAFSDGHGFFRRGDVAEMTGEEMHQPTVEGDEDCINLVVTDAPLRFRDLLPRLAQPFVGF